MSFILRPWQLLLVILAGWMNQQQQELIEYVRTENQVLKGKLGQKRILLSDDQRRRLAVQGKILGRKRLEEIGTLFTPVTILRWHRMLIAQKWDSSDERRRAGRPRIRQVIVDLKTQKGSGAILSKWEGCRKQRWQRSMIGIGIRASSDRSSRKM